MTTSDVEGPGACPASSGWWGWGQWVWPSLHTSDFVHLTELPSLSPPLPSLVVGRAIVDPWSQCKLPHQSPFSAKESKGTSVSSPALLRPRPPTPCHSRQIRGFSARYYHIELLWPDVETRQVSEHKHRFTFPSLPDRCLSPANRE